MASSRCALALLALAASAHGKVFFEERFGDASWDGRWVKSQWKDEAEMGAWTHTSGGWSANADEALGIATTDDLKFHAISAKMDAAASTVDQPLVVQFTVKHEKRDYSFCGGGYIKLLPSGLDQSKFGGDDEYAIMFGPDLCGYDVSRIHLIFSHNGENLLKDDDIKLDYDEKDELTHLYTMVLQPDGSYEVFFDQKSKATGKLADDWAFPSEQIKDPSQSKPADWVDTKKIPDPAAVKPEGYDDIPAEIPDPEAEMPDDWDPEDDGEWEPPLIDNPEYKGEWNPPMIDNPEYKGEWVHPLIPNPDYAPATYAKYPSLEYVGFELWTVNAGSIFDNVLVTDDKAYADEAAAATWGKIKDGESEALEAWKKENEPAGGDEASFDDYGSSYGDEEEPHDEL